MGESVSFGQWLRRCRKALDLTQEQLAREVGYSVSTIRRIEGETLRPSRDLAERLAESLGVPVEQRSRLVRAARAISAEPDYPMPAPDLDIVLSSTATAERGNEPSHRHNLPALRAGFVGRERETLELKGLLGESRLVTVTGSGGVGKSSLALRVASDLVGSYPDGVWLAELASLANQAHLIQAVARAIDVREVPNEPIKVSLLSALRPRHLLLVLDNCEHLIDALAELAGDILQGCPRVTILATSREPLRIHDECAWRLQSLSVPPLDLVGDVAGLASAGTVSRLEEYESVRLFAIRARAVLPRFALSVGNAPAVCEICRRLDGIPLALELAAARVTVLSPQQITLRLGSPFKLLAGGSRTALPRYQTMRAAIDWSHDLLSPQEQALLRRLSVFAGGFSLEAAETVGAGVGVPADEVLDLLNRLVDKSLVVAVEGAGEVRYRVLETIRQYALERLVASGEEEDARSLHLCYCLDLARRSEPALHSTESPAWLDRLETEHDNLRAALAWSLGHDVPRGLELVGSLLWFWDSRCYFREGSTWARRFLAEDSSETIAHLKALHTAAHLVGAQTGLRHGPPPTSGRHGYRQATRGPA